MLAYIVRRLLLMIPTLLGVAVLVFFLLRIVPGDIVEIKLRGDGGTAPASASAIVVLELLVRYMQLWAILCLGVYALSSVLYRVSTLGDRPDAASELTTEISLAKERLRAAGFAF